MKKSIAIRVDHKSYTSVKVGPKWVKITLLIPVEQFAKQAVKAAFGNRAKIIESNK